MSAEFFNINNSVSKEWPEEEEKVKLPALRFMIGHKAIMDENQE